MRLSNWVQRGLDETRGTNHANEREEESCLEFGKHTLLYGSSPFVGNGSSLGGNSMLFTIKPCHDFPVTIY